MTPESETILSFDVDEVLREAARHPATSPHLTVAARRRNRKAAFLFLRAAAKRGVTSADPASEDLLRMFRRDALRDAGVDERLVRKVGVK